MTLMRWLVLALLLAATGCIPAGGGGGGKDDDDGGAVDGGEADTAVDPDDGIPPPDMAVDPDDGIPPPDMAVDPDDGIPPPDMAVDPDDGIPTDMAVEPGAEQCNMLDDDGDGVIDEGFGGLAQPCFVGVGLCEAEGVVICTPDGSGTVCDAQSPGATPEECNGLDDDCDGAVDEDQLPRACATGVAGRCAEGLEQCVGGEPVCIPSLDPVAERCNAEDDDCDGLLDEGTEGAACQTGLLGQCAEGEEVCEGGALTCVGASPREELCGFDDRDCDGRVDEGGVCDACDGVECPAGTVCREGACVPDDPGDATPIAPLGQTVRIAGALTADDPIWQRLGAGCVNRSAGDFHYDAVRVVNRTGAPRLLTITGTWGPIDGYLHVFDDSFDPALDGGCIAGDDDFNGTTASQVTEIPIGVGEVLVIVPSTFDPGQTIPDYTLEVQTLAGPLPDAEGVCDDGLDDDQNGLIDCEDPACDADPVCDVGEPLVPGVQQMVDLADALGRGWRACHVSLYNTADDRMADIRFDCDGAQLMLGCRRANAATLLLAAEGAREDVLFDVGRGQDVSHNANGVEWYYSPTRAWGFAPGGAAVNLNSCDFGGAQPELRMCIHLDAGLGGDVTSEGYRCGDNTLNASGVYERLVLTR